MVLGLGLALVPAPIDGPAPVAAQALEKRGDVREFSVGMAVEDLPDEGYVDFTCADDVRPGEIALDSWDQYRRCPPNQDGHYEVNFRYDDADIRFDKFEGTKIGGQPVFIALVISENGIVEGIRSVTNPNVFYRDRRGAHMLGLRVMMRYKGDWQCRDLPPEGGEEAVGGFFLKQRCELVKGDRRLVVKRDLYRLPGQTIKESFNQGRYEIWREPTG